MALLRSVTARRVIDSVSAGVFSSATGELISPTQIPGLAAWYSMKDAADRTMGTGVQLLRDKSGNSGVNVLALNGVTANYGSSPDSVPTSITGSIDIRARVACDNWTLGSYQPILSKNVDTGSQVSYALGVTATTGTLSFRRSPDGTTANRIISASTVAPTVSNYSDIWVRVTLNTANGDVTFYTGTDGVSWTQLGAVVSTAASGIFDGTAGIEIGSINASATVLTGKVFRAQIYNGIAGTLVFDANFATAAKLATSFTESSSNAATVTINTSGDLGACIIGARDRIQLTGTKQPLISAGGALFDGTDDYLKGPAFSLSQPTTVFFVGQQVTWVGANEKLYDGSGASNRMAVAQANGGASPQLTLNGGSVSAVFSGMAVATNGVLTALFNSAASGLRFNRGALSVLDAGTNAGNGITLGANHDATSPCNILVYEVLIWAGALDEGTQNRVIQFLGRRWGIAV